MIKKNRDAFERLYVLHIPFKLRAATTNSTFIIPMCKLCLPFKLRAATTNIVQIYATFRVFTLQIKGSYQGSESSHRQPGRKSHQGLRSLV